MAVLLQTDMDYHHYIRKSQAAQSYPLWSRRCTYLIFYDLSAPMCYNIFCKGTGMIVPSFALTAQSAAV